MCSRARACVVCVHARRGVGLNRGASAGRHGWDAGREKLDVLWQNVQVSMVCTFTYYFLAVSNRPASSPMASAPFKKLVLAFFEQTFRDTLVVAAEDRYSVGGCAEPCDRAGDVPGGAARLRAGAEGRGGSPEHAALAILLEAVQRTGGSAVLLLLLFLRRSCICSHH